MNFLSKYCVDIFAQLTSMSFESEFKDEIKEEPLDEVLSQEECEHTGDITSDSNISYQCFYDDMGDLSIQKQVTIIPVVE